MLKCFYIHEVIIKSAADLISEDTPDYQYLAARLAIFHLRKKAYAKFDPPHLFSHVKKMVDGGWYDKALLEDFDEKDFNKMNDFIRHSRDLTFSYSAVKQLQGKYLVQDRVTGQIFESAQFLYVLVAASLFAHYPKTSRMRYIERFYNAISTFKISLPTPIMAGIRTPTRQFSSCVLIESGDSLNSVCASSSAIIKLSIPAVPAAVSECPTVALTLPTTAAACPPFHSPPPHRHWLRRPDRRRRGPATAPGGGVNLFVYI